MKFADESRKTWIALVLLGAAAGSWWIAEAWKGAGVSKWLAVASPILAFAGMLMSVPRGALNRTLSRIHDDYRSGRQPMSTALQKICFMLALLLVVLYMFSPHA